MTLRLRSAAPLLLWLLATGCDSTPIQEPNNASTNAVLNAISANMTDDDGKSPTVVPGDADSVGQSMRAGAAARPRKH